MKLKLFLLASVMISALLSQGQIDIKGKIKNKVNQRVDEKVDKEIDKSLDKVEEGAKGKEEGEAEPSGAEEGGNSQAAPVKPAAPATKSYTKFDFIPGEKVIFYEDFSSDAVGDFPANWNTNVSGEVVTLSTAPGKWLQLKPDGAFIPEQITDLPDNFTLEFDMVMVPSDDNPGGVEINFIETDPEEVQLDALVAGKGGAALGLYNHKVSAFNWENKNYGAISSDIPKEYLKQHAGEVIKVSIWRQKERVRMYLDDSKLIDIPRLLPPGRKYNRVRFFTWDRLADGDNFYITNLRMAIGAPDTRNKLLTEGKLVTRGILFDVNSDKIKPESYGTIKDIATVLQENPTVKVKIVGHTDSDGADDTNLDLSGKRAAAVKKMLFTEFGISADRLTTEGKGESEPVTPNTTAEGKANNRRVEFIRL